MVVEAWDGGEWEVTANECSVSFEDDKIFWN